MPPWSPDQTPIKEMISKVKGSMRSAAARTKEAVYAAFASALHDVTPDNIAGCPFPRGVMLCVTLKGSF